MNVKIPVFDQNDQSYEKDVLLDHLEVEPAEPPGRSAEEGPKETWEQYPAVRTRKRSPKMPIGRTRK
jgi:hypothetical protein